MAELTVPQIDFSALGQLPQIYKQGQADVVRQQTLSSLGQGGTADAQALLKSGDLSLAQLGMTIQQRQAEAARQAVLDQRQAERDKVSDQHWGASFELQKRAANRADEDKFTVQKVENPDGTTSFFKYNGRTGDIQPIGAPAASTVPNNPFSAGGKFNGDQGKAAGFTDRMLQSEGILSGIGPNPGAEGPVSPGVQTQGADWAATQASKAKTLPGVGGLANYAVPEVRQKYDQAKADFINAQLRRESGAAIGQSEFENADKQYFPVPGDTPAVMKQKAANRRAAIEAMGREGGSSYRPKMNFDENGTVTPYGQPAPAAPRAAAPAPPKPGQLIEGYRFKGGDPADQNNWVKAQ